VTQNNNNEITGFFILLAIIIGLFMFMFSVVAILLSLAAPFFVWQVAKRFGYAAIILGGVLHFAGIWFFGDDFAQGAIRGLNFSDWLAARTPNYDDYPILYPLVALAAPASVGYSLSGFVFALLGYEEQQTIPSGQEEPPHQAEIQTQSGNVRVDKDGNKWVKVEDASSGFDVPPQDDGKA
jgi:hypothetical protein